MKSAGLPSGHGELFRDPPMRARPAPFWFLNDRLDPERLVRQLDRLLEAGAGGAGLHGRVGLPPEDYLEERWFQAVEAVVGRAAERGATIWLYDELGWPSGSAGGRIPGGREWMSLMHLTLEDEGAGARADPGAGQLLAAFRVIRGDPLHGRQRRRDGGITLLPDRIVYGRIGDPSGYGGRGGDRILRFRVRRFPAQPNYFDPRVTQAFLEVTHERYYRRLASHFGSTITHVFMDEPGVRGGTASLPWDDRFEADFLTRRGYSLLDRLPDLFFEAPGHEATRFDYWTLIGEKFREGFVIPIDRWCQSHGVRSSGHVEYEAALKEAVRQTGSAMPVYEHQGMPGIDILGNDFFSLRFQQEAYLAYLVTIKQASSVDRQLAKGGLMSECYGVGGHAMGPEAMQRSAAFQMALGVTFLCPHAPFYSIRGERKNDCPPFIDWRAPYWPHVRGLFDTVARTGWLLSQGRAVCGTLLLHPMASVHAAFRLPRTEEERKAPDYILEADLAFETVEKHFALLSSALLDAQIDHDYGDEELPALHASAGDGCLSVGTMRYRIVVLPPLITIRSATVALLEAYTAGGGILLAVGSAPNSVDGRPSGAAAALMERCAERLVDGVDRFDYEGVVGALTGLGARTAALQDADGRDAQALKVQRRLWDGTDLLYLANLSRETTGARLTLVPERSGAVEEWEPATGKRWRIGSCRAAEPLSLDLEWAPGEARVLLLRDGEGEELPRRPARARETSRGAPTWSGRRTRANQLVLHPCRFRDGPTLSPPFSASQARDELSRRIRDAGGPVRAEVEYAFTVSPLPGPSLSLHLGIEPAAGMQIRMNGEDVPLRDGGSVLDPAIRLYPLPPCRAGENAILVSAVFPEAEALQGPWLLGEFGLAEKPAGIFEVSAHDASVDIGSWVDRGLPFYAGTVVYSAQVEIPPGTRLGRTVLEMPGLLGTAEIRVNGSVAGRVLWPPYACAIGEVLRPGENHVEVEVANTLRNLLGPHGVANEESMTGFGPECYRTAAGEPMRFQACGLTAAPEIVFTA